MDSDVESSECPLCLEVLEADDLNFYPCTCCYQICRFCWHRIRTDENGLCPACRKPYSENPAQFKPLTEEEVQQVKRDRKLKESNKKPKVTESRKHLANLRVVQRNLVFVNGLPSRLADTELLRRNDHFGKYGKIVKLVTSPAHNGQQNSICVYITYSRSEEALRAIQALCNYHVDGRTLKATLGTTKYCSRYLKGATCQKADCLYLHEPGDPLASFTKEQMQQGLHLEYERKLMEQYASKNASAPATTTPKSGRTTANGHKNESSQRRKYPTQPTPLLQSTTTVNTTNGHSDLESGDETQPHPSNGYNTENFTSTTAIHVDSDSTSTSSHTSSEHDPQMAQSTIPTQTYQVSPTNNNTWPDERPSFLNAPNPPSSQTNLTQSINGPVTSNGYSPKPNTSTTTTTHNPLLAETTSTNPPHTTNTVKQFDQLPEYKLFSSNSPSIHTILFGNHDNSQSNSTSHRPLLNGFGHDVRDIEKKLFEHSLSNGDASSSFLPTQENDELGFDPCSLFMSALASDIEDERRPSSSMLPSRLTGNPFSSYPTQYSSSSGPNLPLGPVNSNWFSQQPAQPQPQYPPQYHDSQVSLQMNGTNHQKTQSQARFPLPFNGIPPRPMWNGNPAQQVSPQPQPQPQQQQQYVPQITSRLDFSNQIQNQRPPPRQASPSPQYPQSIANSHHKNSYSSTSAVPTNSLNNDAWPNLLCIDPAIISFGNKVEPSSSSAPSTSSSQWSPTTQSQGSSTLSSGNNLMSKLRWSQAQGPSVSYPVHMMTNGMYAPFSSTSTVEDGNNS